MWASGQLDTQTQNDSSTVDDAAAQFGISIDDDSRDHDNDSATDTDTHHLWPENVALWGIWLSLQTQWRVGMNGREGLNYAGVVAYLGEVARIRPRQFVQAFGCIQAMESAALNAWAQQRDKNR